MHYLRREFKEANTFRVSEICLSRLFLCRVA